MVSFRLQVFVLGGIGSVLGLLALLFWIYFMYLWRSFENKRDCSKDTPEEEFAEVVDGPEFLGRRMAIVGDTDGAAQALVESRRKSISFTVCTPSKEVCAGMVGAGAPDGESKLSFDITVRTVGLDQNPGSNRSRSGSSVNTSEPGQYFILHSC